MKTKGNQKTNKTTDALKIVDHLIGEDHELREMVEREQLNAHVARMIYEARTKAKLTQAELAALVGTSQSVIARLEDADYEGHSLSMLNRIAEKLNKRVEIKLAPIQSVRRKRSPAMA